VVLTVFRVPEIHVKKPTLIVVDIRNSNSFGATAAVMEALKLKAHIRPDGTVEWPDLPEDLPPGEIEITFRYSSSEESGLDEEREEDPLATEWPRLKGGRWKGTSLRRSDLYDDTGR
jgi:hypothetical protein